MIQSGDGGQRAGASREELAEIKALKAENRRLREDVEILRGATTSCLRSACQGVVRRRQNRSACAAATGAHTRSTGDWVARFRMVPSTMSRLVAVGRRRRVCDEALWVTSMAVSPQ
jgi:hypothetical protein